MTDHCPTCSSPQPHLHPQKDGTSQTCPDPWHASTVRGTRVLRILSERGQPPALAAPTPEEPTPGPPAAGVDLETAHLALMGLGLVPPGGGRLLAEEFVLEYRRAAIKLAATAAAEAQAEAAGE